MKYTIIALLIGMILISGCAIKQPECYIIRGEDDCFRGYDKMNLMFDSNNSLKQCCNKPHYVLQGMDVEVLDYCIDFKEDVLDQNLSTW